VSGSPAKIKPVDYDLVRALPTTLAVVERFGVSLSTAHKHRKRAAAQQPPGEVAAEEPAGTGREDSEPLRQQAEPKPEPARLEPPASSPTPTLGRRDGGGVPIFPDTPAGNAERFAYYDARKLNHLPNSLLDYNDVVRGRETPAERRARERDATRPR
jgi:hypothetical protein